LEHSCRVLILYNKNKEICRSTFAVEVEKDLAVLCSHEYHSDHRGWHCHVISKDHASIELGIFRGRQKRWPSAKVPHSKLEFGVTEVSALSHAASRYNFEAQGGLI